MENYKQYLERIDSYLEKFFAQQQPYIHCKEGCSICCELGDYPFSRLEYQYVMIGYDLLLEQEKTIINEKISNLKTAKEKTAHKKFLYECPFLINKKCSIYKHRGLVCRSYGLLQYNIDENDNRTLNIPYCVEKGLNYSNVFDSETNSISSQKWKATEIEAEPLFYNVGIEFLLDNEMTEEFELEFGASKALIDWFD